MNLAAKRTVVGGLSLLGCLGSLVSAPVAIGAPQTEMVSVTSGEDNPEGSAYVWRRSASHTGRFVAFETTQPLAGVDSGNGWDVYLRDTKTGKTILISRTKNGGPSQDSDEVEISADGKLVLFVGGTDDLVKGDDNGYPDVFIYNRRTKKMERVSVRSNGDQLELGASEAGLSPNGRWVVFSSRSPDVVSGDTNSQWDVFLHDRKTGKTRRVSVTSDGEQVTKASSWGVVADNGTVAFMSQDDDLVKGDDNNASDVFVHYRRSGKTKRVSVTSAGEQSPVGSEYPSISGDGRVVSFYTHADNFPGGGGGYLVQYVHILKTGKTKLISKNSQGEPANGQSYSYEGALSYTGRYVVFTSAGDNLFPNDTNGHQDFFWHDRKTGKTKLVSVTHDGSDLTIGANEGTVSGDGKWVFFDTSATNILPGDTFDNSVFVRGPMH